MTPPSVSTLPLSQLAPPPWSARGMTQLMLPFFRKSLDRFGSVRLPVWNSRTGDLVDGHELVRAMLDDGWTEAEVVVVDLSEPEAKALHIELHSAYLRGKWDHGKLAELVEDIQAGAPELLDELSVVELEIWAARRIDELTPAEELPGQRLLMEV